MTREPIPNCPQPDTPIRARAWTNEQIAAMERDAGRYRWLRRMIYDERIITAPDHQASMLHSGQLDAAVDGAMRGETP